MPVVTQDETHLNMSPVGRLILHISILAKVLVALLALQWWLFLVRPGLAHARQVLLAKAGGAWVAAARAQETRLTDGFLTCPARSLA